MNCTNFIVDAPVGQIYRFDTPDELKEFMHLIGTKSEDLGKFEMKFVEVEGREYDSCIDGFSFRSGEYEYSEEVQVLIPKEKEYFVCTLHDTNQFMDEQYGHKDDLEDVVQADEIELTDYWNDKFPCVIYIHLESTFDRMGDVEFSIFHVQPLNTIPTVNTVNNFLAENANRQLELYEQYSEWERMWKEHNRKKLEEFNKGA